MTPTDIARGEALKALEESIKRSMATAATPAKKGKKKLGVTILLDEDTNVEEYIESLKEAAKYDIEDGEGNEGEVVYAGVVDETKPEPKGTPITEDDFERTMEELEKEPSEPFEMPPISSMREVWKDIKESKEPWTDAGDTCPCSMCVKRRKVEEYLVKIAK